MPPFNILESASPELRTWLLVNGESMSIPTETVLIKEGERTPNPIVLLEGHLNVTTSNKQQGQEQLSSLTPGCLVGEMSWLEKRPAVATITSSGDCTVLRLSIQQLELLESQQPALAAQLHHVIAQKLAVQIQGQNIWAHRLHTDHGPVEALRKVLTLFSTLQEQDVFKLARSFGGHFGLVSGHSRVVSTGVISGSFRGHSRVVSTEGISGSFRESFRQGPFPGRYGVISGSCQGHFERGRSGVI